MKRRFVLLDRDGTIIIERNYLRHPRQVELIPGAAWGLRQLSEMGLGLVVITNQSGLARGFFDQARLNEIHERLRRRLVAEGVYLTGIYVCPHLPEDNCLCRKPAVGLLELAARELDFDPQASFLIGDKVCDIEAGQRFGATTILVRTGYGAGVAAGQAISPDHVVDDLSGAAQVIRRVLAQNGDSMNKDGSR